MLFVYLKASIVEILEIFCNVALVASQIALVKRSCPHSASCGWGWHYKLTLYTNWKLSCIGVVHMQKLVSNLL